MEIRTLQELVNEAISQVRSTQGLRQLYLTVLDVNNKAIHFYKTAGLEMFAHEPESVKIKDKLIDELQMVCFLTRSNSSTRRDAL
jgi:hypothetical protein